MDSPSAKALGKRKAVSVNSALSSYGSDSGALGKANPPSQPGTTPSTPNGVAPAVQGRITRATRSSLGGASEAGASGQGSETSSPFRFLPVDTRIRLVSKLPSNVKHFPFGVNDPAAIPRPEADAANSTNPLDQSNKLTPIFRLLTPADSTTRSRHGGAEACDMSDAYYQRLHRFPEVLEKRSARLEVEKLISERNKLINELEELKGRGRVYAGVLGGKGEEERKRKIEEGEKKLLRYDYLLPNQPRKSSALNVTANAAAASTPTARSASPLASTSRERQPTPLSAQGGTTHTAIRIKFTQGRNGAITGGKQVDAIRPKAGSHPAEDEEEEDELEDDDLWDEGAAVRRHQSQRPRSVRMSSLDPAGGGDGDERRGPKRDRKAEKARRDERERLGLPPRVDLEKAARRMSAGAGSAGLARRPSVVSSGGMDGSDVEMDELEDEVDQLEEEAEVAEQLVIKKRKKRRAELMGTFFPTKALRDSAMNHQSASRGSRRSSRVEYAFGQPTPSDLLVEQDFSLRSYYLDDTPSIESLVRARLGDDAPILLNGIWVPTSSFTALVHPPVNKHDPTHIVPAADPNTVVTATVSAASASTVAGSSPADVSTPASTQASAGAGGATVEIKEERAVVQAGQAEWAAPEPAGTPLVPHEYVRVVPKRKAPVKRRRSSIAPRAAQAAPAVASLSASTGSLPKLRLSLSRPTSVSPVPPAAQEEQRSKPRPSLAISVPPPAPTQPQEASSPLTPIATTAENASAVPSPRPAVRPYGEEEEPVSPASSDVMIVDEVRPAVGGKRGRNGSPARLPLPVFPPEPKGRGGVAEEEVGLVGGFAAPPPRGADVLLKGRGKRG